MSRIDGYLNLDEIIEKSKGTVRKSSYTSSTDHYWINLHGQDYYYKEMLEPGYSELICAELAKMLGLDAVEYDLALYQGKKGVISKSYKKKYSSYYTGHQILQSYYIMCPEVINDMGLENVNWKETANEPWYFHMNNLMTIWQALELIFPEADIPKLMNKVVEQFMFMILTEQYDKGAQNWEVEVTGKHADIVPLYDNESGFSGINEAYGMTMSFTTDFNDTDGFIKDVLKRFLYTSSREFIDRFIEMFNALNDELFDKAINNVENKIGVKIPEDKLKGIRGNYLNNKNKISEALEELNLNKGR